MIIEQFFEDYVLGSERRSFGRTITETDFVVHAGHTGDFFPHHMDADWCATQEIGQRIAHGTLVFSIGIGLTATVINPRAMSYGYDRLRFIRPVHIGDTITSRSEIVGLREHPKNSELYGFADEQVEVVNQRGEVVVAFVHLYLVNRRPGSPS